jgi:hypothetical protein
LTQFPKGTVQTRNRQTLAVSCPQLDQLWFTTNTRRARTLASLISRIAPVEFEVKIDIVETELPPQYMAAPSPVIIDRRPQWGKRNLPYAGPTKFTHLDSYEGRGQQFTLLEKERSFKSLKEHIPAQYWAMLAPIGALLSLPRTELPPMRAMKQMKKEHR